VAKQKDSTGQGKQMLVGVTSSPSHGNTRSTASSVQVRGPPQHSTSPNRTEQTYSNQNQTQKSLLENGEKPEAMGSLKWKHVLGAEFL